MAAASCRGCARGCWASSDAPRATTRPWRPKVSCDDLCRALDTRYSNVQTKVPATAICSSTVTAKSVRGIFIHRLLPEKKLDWYEIVCGSLFSPCFHRRQGVSSMLPTWTSSRPDSWADKRQLHLPSALLSADQQPASSAWAAALCAACTPTSRPN